MSQHILKMTAFMMALSVASISQAEWNPAARQWAQELSKQAPTFHDGVLMSLWASVRAREIIPTTFLQLPLQVHARIHIEKSFFSTVRAPLVIVVPGIFNDADDPLPRRTMRQLKAQGLHVVALANPWGEDALNARLPHSPGNVEREAETYLSWLPQILDTIGRDHIEKIHLWGESYGAMLAAIMASKDSQSPQPLINGSVFLLAPPVSMQQATQHIDQLLDESENVFFTQECETHATSLSLFIDVHSSLTEKDLSDRTRHCGRAITAFSGFQHELVRVAKTLDARHPVSRIPNQEWIKNLRFQTFIDTFTPELSAAEDKIVQLHYWILNSPHELQHRIHILTAQNDFLNDADAWSKAFPPLFLEQNILFLSWGGHLGFAALDAYEQLLRRIF